MLIRKTQQPSDFPENQIHDAYSTSTTDTYSCNYLNENIKSSKNYTILPDNTDLNTVLDYGTYRSTATSHTSTMSNLPSGVTAGFTMYVSSWTSTADATTYRRQEIVQYYNTYVRYTNSEGASWSSWIKMRGIETIYTGSVSAGNSITLTNVKRFLDVYVHLDFSTMDGIIKYTIDTSLGNNTFGGGMMTPFDEGNMNTYYVSESQYNKANTAFTHRRIGYFNITNGVYTARQDNASYYVYRIDTYD